MTDTDKTLSFELIDKRFTEMTGDEKDRLFGILEKVTLLISLTGAAFGLFAANFFNNQLVLVRIGLWVEIIAGVIFIGLLIKRTWPDFHNAKHNFSKGLDSDFEKYSAFVDWLKRFPTAQRVARFRYVRDRKNAMNYRLGIMLGGVEKLGLFPVFIALYFQFKDWRWGDWQALTNTSLLSGFFIWMIFLTYALGWFLVALKGRLEAMECVLEESISD